MSPLVYQLRLFVCAVQFLTRLPTPPLADFQSEWIARSAPYFPLVGQIVGLLSATVWMVASHVWPGWPAALLTVGASALITGGFHEDGLADTADGLGGGQTRERRLEIMKDSRLGTYGALALVLGLGLRAGMLSGLTPGQGALALVVAHGGARAAAVVVMAALPYSGDVDAAKVKPALNGVSWAEAGIALALGVWPVVFLGLQHALIGLGLATAASLAMALLARRLIGGVTGDVLGAVEQLSEIGLLAGSGRGGGGVRLAVCPLSDVPGEAARLRPAGVVSLLAPGQSPPELPPGPARLYLPFHDIVEASAGLVVPDEEMVAQLLAFPADFAPDATVLIHCWMGISRSPAAAFALACALAPERDEAALAAALRAASPSATPNRRLVALTDQQLGRGGRMSAAIVAIGRGEDAFVGAPFTLEV